MEDLAQRAAAMQRQRDAMRVKAAHARFGASAGGGGSLVSDPPPRCAHDVSPEKKGAVGPAVGDLGSRLDADDDGDGGEEADEESWRQLVQRGDEDLEDAADNDVHSLRSFLRRAQDALARQRETHGSDDGLRTLPPPPMPPTTRGRSGSEASGVSGIQQIAGSIVSGFTSIFAPAGATATATATATTTTTATATATSPVPTAPTSSPPPTPKPPPMSPMLQSTLLPGSKVAARSV